MKDLENKDPGVHNLLLSLYAKKVNPLTPFIFMLMQSCCMLTVGSSYHSYRVKNKTHVLVFAFSLFLLDMIMVVPDSLCIEAILLLLHSCHIHIFGSSFFYKKRNKYQTHQAKWISGDIHTRIFMCFDLSVGR